eukprot:12277642-Alexandrium_andersonii.AAC.1
MPPGLYELPRLIAYPPLDWSLNTWVRTRRTMLEDRDDIGIVGFTIKGPRTHRKLGKQLNKHTVSHGVTNERSVVGSVLGARAG